VKAARTTVRQSEGKPHRRGEYGSREEPEGNEAPRHLSTIGTCCGQLSRDASLRTKTGVYVDGAGRADRDGVSRRGSVIRAALMGNQRLVERETDPKQDESAGGLNTHLGDALRRHSTDKQRNAESSGEEPHESAHQPSDIHTPSLLPISLPSDVYADGRRRLIEKVPDWLFEGRSRSCI
jgi:hypothetical protein